MSVILFIHFILYNSYIHKHIVHLFIWACMHLFERRKSAQVKTFYRDTDFKSTNTKSEVSINRNQIVQQV